MSKGRPAPRVEWPTLRRRPARVLVAVMVVTQVVATAPLFAQTARPAAVATPAPTPEAARLTPPKLKVNRTVPKVAPPPQTPQFSAQPTAQEIFRARVFREPLVLVGGDATPEENTRLAAALVAYHASDNRAAVAPLEAFLATHAESHWRASLLVNLGRVYKDIGAFSRALTAFDQAWRLAAPATDPHGRAVADLAVGEWLSLAVQFGQAPLVAARLDELRGRSIGGSAAALVREAREAATVITGYPRRVIASGPEAIKHVLHVLGRDRDADRPPLRDYVPVAAGTSLAEVAALASAVGLPLTAAYRREAEEVPVPAIIHWQLGHFSAVTGRDAGGYRLVDPAIGGTRWISATTLRAEMSGYALVPTPLAAGWETVTDLDAARIIGHSTGQGLACGDVPDDDCDCPSGGSGGGGGGGGGGGFGMPVYNFHPTAASLRIIDTPIGYTPARGPAADFRLTYNQREAYREQIPSFGNVGPRWTFVWLSYIQEVPWGCFIQSGGEPQCYAHVWVHLSGGWRDIHSGMDGQGVFPVHPRSRAQLVRTQTNPVRYERRLPDGRVDVYGQPDGSPVGSQRVFLTERRDARGQSLHFAYDAQSRLVAMTDALGQVTTIEYTQPTDPLKITAVEDPFGRRATFQYTAAGQLAAITDTLGLTSSFLYGPEDFVEQMTTPYGTTTFRHEAVEGEAVNRLIEATDPTGATERLVFSLTAPDVPAQEASADVPAGFTSWNAYLNESITLYWDKRAAQTGLGDTATATITKWMWAAATPGWASSAIPLAHSVKRPLERRVWHAYQGQPVPPQRPEYFGSLWKCSRIGRVLDDGSSQIREFTYNTLANVLTQIDPVGRRTAYTYAANGRDVLEVRNTTGALNDLLASYSNYTATGQPQTITDAAAQTTAITYTTSGQPLTVTNAKNETTTYTYDTLTGQIATVTGSVSGSTTTYTYDGYGRLRTVTDPDGYTVTTDYDVFDRPIRVTYPDDTYEALTYDRLDLATRRDRLGRTTRYAYDPLRRLVGTRDPLGRTITQDWCACGSLNALIDAKGQKTTWERDVQGRVTREVRADGTTDTLYTYDGVGRLKTIKDPKDQVTTYTYTADDQLATMVFTNAQIATPSVSYTYDEAYPRVATMVDGIGTTSYAYHAAGQLGAGQVASVDGPLTDDTITYAYDELGRVTTRAISGVANTVTWAFDALGRVTSETNVLGTFTYGYDGVTSRLASVAYPNNQTSTYSYLPAAQDLRLQTIHHKYPSGATLSKFDYTYDAVGNIVTWRQQADATAVLWHYAYDAADQLIAARKESTDPTPLTLQRFAYAYDPAGNRTVEQIDDVITFTAHDELNRLVQQVPGGPIAVAGSVNEPATVTINGQAATLDALNQFRGTTSTAAGTSAFTIAATDPSNNTATAQWEIDQTGASKTFTFDANGNLTADGTRIFEWDARNQLVTVTVGTHRSEFTYDGAQRRVRIVEKENGGTQSDTKVLWCEDEMCDERAADGLTVARRAFGLGEQVTGYARYFTMDHLESVGEVTDTPAGLLARYAFDPWGNRTVIAGTDVTTAGFAGLRVHAASALAVGLYRGYDAGLARWLSKDPLGDVDGPNRYAYVGNSPLSRVDPLGL